jgi:cation:H+ antiporter
MINDIFILITSLFLLIKGATLATKYSGHLAENFNLSKYTISFIIVAVISIIPETFIAINSALVGNPSFGLATLFGGNIADLTLVFFIIIILSGRNNLKIESKILKNHTAYPFILLVPILLGLNGHFSRVEGLTLIIIGIIFYYIAFKNGDNQELLPIDKNNNKYKNSLLLVFSMIILLVGSHFTVTSAVGLAGYLKINSILIGMFIVGLGTVLPELFYSLKAVKKRDDSLAIGDILGTVLADSTIVIGILALIRPFNFPQKIVYITGVFMVTASFILFRFMKTDRVITKKEAYSLLIFWILFIIVEFLINTY